MVIKDIPSLLSTCCGQVGEIKKNEDISYRQGNEHSDSILWSFGEMES